jgi:D-ribose pyranose/furanose isomerase RbsD
MNEVVKFYAKDAAKEAERIAEEAERRAEDQRRELERVSQQIADAQAKISDRQFEIELARAEELANVRTGAVEINDIRSGGISAFFDTLKEDPAIAEAKAQTKELQAMRKEIAKLNAEKVDILAGTG